MADPQPLIRFHRIATRRRSTPTTRTGFTLVELLVVIVVAVLFLGVMMPASWP